jgi:tetratricopeptide (TPR) repeat protein
MSRYRSEIIVSLFLIVSVLAVYGQVRHHEFINYDDDDYVAENRHVQAGWTMEGLGWAFTTRFHRHWHPLTWLSHMTDCQFFGLDPGWHHLSSVFLHMANSLLLFFVFRRMTGALFRSGFVAALFALHPLNVETVAWVADRKDVLSAFFWMLTIWAYIRYAERPGVTRYALVFVAFILGLMAKSMVVTLPFVLLLMDYWPLDRFEFGPSRREGQPINRTGLHPGYQKASALRLVWEKALFFVMIGGCGIIAISAFYEHRTLSQALSGLWPTKRHIADCLLYYVGYMGKMLYPLNLATPYPPHSGHAVVPLWQVGGAGLLLLGISFMVFWHRRRYPYLLLGWLWYLITLVPVIGLVGIGPDKMGDRYTYIPLIGLFVIMAWGVPDLVKRWRYRRTALATSAGIVLLGCMTGSWLQARHWKNSISLFSHSVKVTPNNYVAHNNLGVALDEEGRLKEAIGHFSEALRIRPAYADGHNNLGLVLTKQGRLEEAVEHFSEAIRISPTYAEAHNKLGVALSRQGRFNEAMGHFSEALKIKPGFAKAHNNLGLALAGQGRLNEAIQHYTEAFKIEPDYAEAHNNLGLALVEQGNLEEAVGHFSEALKLEPDYAKAHNNLGMALARQGRLKEAVGHFSEALKIQPDYAEAHNNLGLALAEQGRFKEAIGHFSEALRIRPNYARARHNLELGLRVLGKAPWASGTR